MVTCSFPYPTFPSPFVRREWIEILLISVMGDFVMSPFVRREWIEIVFEEKKLLCASVSLREKGVD